MSPSALTVQLKPDMIVLSLLSSFIFPFSFEFLPIFLNEKPILSASFIRMKDEKHVPRDQQLLFYNMCVYLKREKRIKWNLLNANFCCFFSLLNSMKSKFVTKADRASTNILRANTWFLQFEAFLCFPRCVKFYWQRNKSKNYSANEMKPYRVNHQLHCHRFFFFFWLRSNFPNFSSDNVMSWSYRNSIKND